MVVGDLLPQTRANPPLRWQHAVDHSSVSGHKAQYL